ncbi:MAG: S8 family serine peptidase [Bacteroidetes bacterium]|nr:S8 family serine peptidase [Bacteroidota bacterium]
MNKKNIIITLCFIIGLSSLKSQSKYWVKFKNKNGTPYSVSTPTAFLTPKSVLRRTTYNIPVDQTDLPVTPAYLSQVDNVSGVTVLYASKWINGVVIATTNTTALSTINSFSFVLSSSPVNRFKVNIPKNEVPEFNSQNKTASPEGFNYGGSFWQNKQLGVDCIHSAGFRGQGMTIAVLDDGFNNVNVNPVFDSLRNRGGILGTRDFVVSGNNVYNEDSHGALVLSCMAAIKPNVILGSAPRADYWLLRTEDIGSETPSEEYNWIRAAEFADSVGADVLTTSLGYYTFDNPAQNHTLSDLNGKTVHMSIASTMAVRKGMFVLNAAGNAGGASPSTIGIPADADSICTVGAIDSTYNLANFSSVGPTADGRIKPDLMARGSRSWVSFPNGTCGQSNGTSFSTPILAGAVACFWQAHKTWNSMKILDTLRKTANNAGSPNNQYGWGVPNMCSIPTAIKNASALKYNFTISPNPFTSIVQISTSASLAELKINIYNNLGEKVKIFIFESGKTNMDIDLSDLANGIYFVKINGNSAFEVKKLIKQ